MPDTPVADLDHADDGRYTRYHAARDEQRPDYDQHRAEVRALRGAQLGSSVLEAGGGTGAHLPYFWQLTGPDGRVVAFDASEKMLDLARARLIETFTPLRSEGANAGVELLHGRLGEQAFETVFDVVLANRLLGHLDDPVAGRRALAHAVTPEGVVFVNLLNAATTVSLGAGPADRALSA